MSHFVYVRPGANWTGSATVTPAEMGLLDAQLFAAVNGDGGGTWSPIAPIIIGGSGLQITGIFQASDCTSFVMTSGVMNIQSGAEILISSGGQFVGASGSTWQQSGLLEVTSTGTLQLDSGVDPTYSPTRTVVKKGLVLLGTTYGGQAGNSFTSTPTNADVWWDNTVGPNIVTRGLTAIAGQVFTIAVPGVDQMSGQTLVSVQLVTMGVNGIVPTTYPTYNVLRTNGTSSVQLRAAGAVTDHHSTPTPWLATLDTTTYTCDQNNTGLDPGTYRYYVACGLPAAPTGTGAQMFMVECIATYTVATLRK